ncbi:hypothetical protein ACS0TY_013457 [Phlomoides rotata]
MCQSRFLLWGTYLWEDLDIAIVKATNHYERPAKERHIRGPDTISLLPTPARGGAHARRARHHLPPHFRNPTATICLPTPARGGADARSVESSTK